MVRSLVQEMGKPPDDLDPRGAFVELQGVTDYAGLGCKLAPLDIDQLSLPPQGFRPQPLAKLLGAGGSDWVERLIHDSVLPESQATLAREA